MVSGAQGSTDAYVAVSTVLELPNPEPQPEPQDKCVDVPEWSPNVFYPAGALVQYWGNRFTATTNNWGADPFQNSWYWTHEGLCM